MGNTKPKNIVKYPVAMRKMPQGFAVYDANDKFITAIPFGGDPDAVVAICETANLAHGYERDKGQYEDTIKNAATDLRLEHERVLDLLQEMSEERQIKNLHAKVVKDVLVAIRTGKAENAVDLVRKAVEGHFEKVAQLERTYRERKEKRIAALRDLAKGKKEGAK